MTKDLNLDRSTLDWFLPNNHERAWWSQFMRGGRTFLDVGAHVGTWTLNIGKAFGRVICFEPDPRGCIALRENLRRANMHHVTVVQAAVGASDGEVQLSLYPNPCTNTTLPTETGRGVGAGDSAIAVETVRQVSLDSYCRSHGIDDVDLVKVDTEGAECMVIQGGLEMWRKNRPDFFVELHGPFHRECRKLLDFEECDAIDMGGWGFSLVRHRSHWDMQPKPEHLVIYPHGTDATDADLMKFGGRDAWIRFKAVMV
jgi:FkbM family methyltransferase